MSRLDDIEATLRVAEELLQKIMREYGEALTNKTLSAALPVHIKNYLENLRSPLDYIACEITERMLCLGEAHKPYFPIASCYRVFIN